MKSSTDRYDLLNRPLISAATTHVMNQFPERDIRNSFTKNQAISLDQRLDTEGAYNVLNGSIDFLDTQGVLTKDNDAFSFSLDQARGAMYFVNKEIQLQQYLEAQDMLIESLKSGSGLDTKKLQVMVGDHMWVNPTLSYINENGLNADSKELRRHKDMMKLFEMVGVYKNGAFTEAGEKLLNKGGYATLLMSYYQVFANLNELSEGHEYGPDGIYREQWLNALGSNGIIEKRVTPEVINIMQSPEFKELLGGEDLCLLGMGCGAGLFEQEVATEGAAKEVYGMDLSSTALDTGRAMRNERGIENISFFQGNMLDTSWYQHFTDGLYVDGKPQPNVGVTNFIPHDLDNINDPDRLNSTQYLELYRKYFPGKLLIISESFKVPQEVMKLYPGYQAASFKYLHDISGQHLFSQEEFETHVKKLGYEIVMDPLFHSSMPNGEHDGGRIQTIGTYFLRAAA